MIGGHAIKGPDALGRRGTSSKDCPWCYRAKLEFRASARSVRFECSQRCGYLSTWGRTLLSKEDRQEIYGEKPEPEDGKMDGYEPAVSPPGA